MTVTAEDIVFSWQRFTGHSAALDDGRSFDELLGERTL